MRAPAIGERWEARRLLAILAALAVAAAMVLLYGGIALADHIPDTGTVPNHCVKFDFGQDAEGSTKSPVNYPDVDITLDDWYNSDADPHSIDFTVAGLAAGQYVDASTKSGNNDPEDSGPYGNGSWTFDSELQNGISHVTFCVFIESTTTTSEPTTTTSEPTTTTSAPTTTTSAPTTTTSEPTTTTSAPTTTTSEPTTTTSAPTTTTSEPTTTTSEPTTTTSAPTTTTTEDDEVLPTVVTTAPDEVDDEELPFTGLDSDVMIGLAIVFLAAGVVLLTMTRRLEEN